MRFLELSAEGMHGDVGHEALEERHRAECCRENGLLRSVIEVREQERLRELEELDYEVRMPLARKTARLSDIIMKLDPANATAVEWEEKKEKK